MLVCTFPDFRYCSDFPDFSGFAVFTNFSYLNPEGERATEGGFYESIRKIAMK